MTDDIEIRQDPIFLVGLPRSGTTLLQALIASQQGIYSFPETHFFDLVYNHITITNESISFECIGRVLQEIGKYKSLSLDTQNKILHLSKKNILTVKQLFESIVTDNLKNIQNLSDISTVRWLEKTPDHVFHIDTIHELYPEAKFVYIIRDPINQILSVRAVSQFWDGSQQPKPIEFYATRWLEALNKVHTFKLKNPHLIRTVRLEDLVKDTESQMKAIFEYLEINYDIKRLQNYKSVASEITRPWEHWKSNVFEKSINTETITRTGESLTDFEKVRLINILRPNLNQYNYYYESPNLPSNNAYDPEEIMNALIFYRQKDEHSSVHNIQLRQQNAHLLSENKRLLSDNKRLSEQLRKSFIIPPFVTATIQIIRRIPILRRFVKTFHKNLR